MIWGAFVAVRPSEGDARTLLSHVHGTQRIHVVCPQFLHLTVRYLGFLDRRKVGPVNAALEALGADPPPLEIGAGDLEAVEVPELRRTFILTWLINEGQWTSWLGRVQAEIDFFVSSSGAAQHTSARPHVTLGYAPLGSKPVVSIRKAMSLKVSLPALCTTMEACQPVTCDSPS
jgi:2'-5' RNA ligase